MHLLDEELGALDGLYETLLGAINEAMKNKALCIVGATATLERVIVRVSTAGVAPRGRDSAQRMPRRGGSGCCKW